MSRLDIFSIRDEDKNPIVVGLLGILKERDVEIQKLKEEIARLKKYPSKPGNLSKRDISISKKEQTGMPISRGLRSSTLLNGKPITFSVLFPSASEAVRDTGVDSTASVPAVG